MHPDRVDAPPLVLLLDDPPLLRRQHRLAQLAQRLAVPVGGHRLGELVPQLRLRVLCLRLERLEVQRCAGGLVTQLLPQALDGLVLHLDHAHQLFHLLEERLQQRDDDLHLRLRQRQRRAISPAARAGGGRFTVGAIKAGGGMSGVRVRDIG